MYFKEKPVAWKNLRKGTTVFGCKNGGENRLFRGVVVDSNPAFVTVKIGDYEDKISSDNMFLVEMPDDEFRMKYNSYAGELVAAARNELSMEELGQHDMYNGWIPSDPWLLAERCFKGGITIIGHCSDIPEKPRFDIGLCAEDHGERFWCHFSSDGLEQLTKGYEIYQDLRKRGLPWMYEHEMGKLVTQQLDRRYGGGKS